MKIESMLLKFVPIIITLETALEAKQFLTALQAIPHHATYSSLCYICKLKRTLTELLDGK